MSELLDIDCCFVNQVTVATAATVESSTGRRRAQLCLQVNSARPAFRLHISNDIRAR